MLYFQVRRKVEGTTRGCDVHSWHYASLPSKRLLWRPTANPSELPADRLHSNRDTETAACGAQTRLHTMVNVDDQDRGV